MKKLIGLALVVGILSLTLGSGLATAAQPNNQGCLGTDISSAASGLGVGWGQFAASVAQTPNGFGDEVQAHLAGLMPDAVMPNTCND